MEIIVNGQTMTIDNNLSILELLDNLQVKEKTMAVAINMEIIKKESWASHQLKEADKLELLHFVGGG